MLMNGCNILLDVLLDSYSFTSWVIITPTCTYHFKASTFRPQESHGHYTVVRARGVRNLNLAWLGWKIWTLTGSGVKSFQRKTRVLYFNMVMFKGKELTLASERLIRKGLQGLSLKTRSMRVGEGGGRILKLPIDRHISNVTRIWTVHVYKLLLVKLNSK